jgi:hypothetical protein
MPIIAAYADHPTRPYVRVEINWADVPAANYAGVSRVDVATGECTELRPYICYQGNELLLSCGHGTFWDTEAPFDRPFYYITTSSEAPCVPLALTETATIYDPFNRDLVNSWGSTDTGQPYTNTGGVVPDDYDVAAGVGTQTNQAVNALHWSTVDAGTTNQDFTIDTMIAVAAPTGAPFSSFAVARFADTNNNLVVRLAVNTDLTLALDIRQFAGGVGSVVSSSVTVGAGHLAGDWWRIRVQATGSNIRARAWLRDLNAEPTTWQVENTVPVTPTGTRVGAASRLDVGNTNALPVVFQWDNLVVNDCPDCEPVTADTSSTPITLVNDGRFWLKDPVRPCNDQPVPLCANAAPVLPGCAGEDGDITFVEVGAEIYADNSLRLRPMNRSRTISITRPRSDVTTTLVLETTTFTARDEVLELVAPGTPLLFQGPSEYGVPDRYMAVGPVNIERQVSDHRIQFRKATLPYEAVDRPAGPSQGICGTRVADICALYPTWDDLAAAGFTWDDLIRGAADPAIANPDRRTWNDVNAEFADWDAVKSGGRTWTGLLEGD